MFTFSRFPSNTRYLCLTKFPQTFCSTRWTENEEATTKELLTWDNACKIIQYH